MLTSSKKFRMEDPDIQKLHDQKGAFLDVNMADLSTKLPLF